MAKTTEEQLADLYEIRDNIVTLIGQITAKPKPTYDIDGQMIKWTEYLDQLRKSKAQILQDIIDLEGPYEFETQAYL